MFGDRSTVQQLSQSTFKIWFKQIESIFQAKGIDHLINKKYADNQVSQDDKKGQGKCMSIIRSSLSNDDQLLIINCSTAYEAFDLLKTSHLTKDNSYNLNKELSQLKWGVDSVELFLSKINDIRIRMNSLQENVAVEDTIFISKINDEMPRFMAGIQSTYQVKLWNGEDIDYTEYTKTVISAYHHLLEKKNEERKNKSSAFYAGNSYDTCRKCNSIQHSTHQCPRNHNRNNRVRYSRYQQTVSRANRNQYSNNTSNSMNCKLELKSTG